MPGFIAAEERGSVTQAQRRAAQCGCEGGCLAACLSVCQCTDGRERSGKVTPHPAAPVSDGRHSGRVTAGPANRTSQVLEHSGPTESSETT